MTDLFDWSKAYRPTDPVTSPEAARSAMGLAARHHELILRVLRSTGRAMAAEEIGDDCDIHHVAINRRLTELVRAGLIYRTTERHRNRSWRHALRYALSYKPGASSCCG